MEEDIFNTEVQRLLISFMISDKTAFVRSQSIIKPEYFDSKLSSTVRFIIEHYDQYQDSPSPEQVRAITSTEIDKIDLRSSEVEWYLKNIEKFCRGRGLETAILDSADILSGKKNGDIQKMIADAMSISLLKDLGTSYFDNPKARLDRLKDRSNFMSTGWATLDRKLYGGYTRGSLNIFAGGSGSGKSLFLLNTVKKWSLMGKNVVYITLELSEDLVNLRLDAMMTGQGTKDIMRNIDDTAMRIMNLKRSNKPGDIKVKKLPEAGTTANHIRAYLKEYEVQEDKKPDILVVDYLDLMHPNNAKIDVSNLFTKDKFVSEEMRALGSEWDIPVVSASQLNRSSVDAQEFDHSHIAGGISKINTADNVFGIYTSITLRERGIYSLQMLKTRSSSSVGEKIELKYNINSMAIDDMDNSDEDDLMRPKSSDEMRAELKEKLANNAPRMETISNSEGMSISQMAHPAHKSREEIEEERIPTSSPTRTDIHSLISRVRKGEM